MVDEQDYSFDQMSASIDSLIKKLKEAEKLFTKMLNTAQKLNQTKMSGAGGGSAGGNSAGGAGATSGVGSASWNNIEKQAREQMKQMQEMYEIRANLIQLDYDELGISQKLQGERVKENILLRRSNNMMVEEEKTKRAKLKIFSKTIGLAAGGNNGLFSMEGLFGMGAQGIVRGGSEGGEKVANKFDGFQERIQNYQKNLTSRKTSFIGSATSKTNEESSKMFQRINKFAPKLTSSIFGKMGAEGTEGRGKRSGGLLGKAGGMAGKAGGIAGMAGMAGGGIMGGLIMKGLESSPMFQGMSKLMSQAFALYLRPIGDFVGGFIRPIATVMIKQAAISMMKTGKLISMGEQVGKHLISLITNPLGFMESAMATMIRGIDEWWHRGVLPSIEKFMAIFGTREGDYGGNPNYISKYAPNIPSLDDFSNETYNDLILALDVELKSLRSMQIDGMKNYVSSEFGTVATTIKDSYANIATSTGNGLNNIATVIETKMDSINTGLAADFDAFRRHLQDIYDNGKKPIEDKPIEINPTVNPNGNNTNNETTSNITQNPTINTKKENLPNGFPHKENWNNMSNAQKNIWLKMWYTDKANREKNNTNPHAGVGYGGKEMDPKKNEQYNEWFGEGGDWNTSRPNQTRPDGSKIESILIGAGASDIPFEKRSARQHAQVGDVYIDGKWYPRETKTEGYASGGIINEPIFGIGKSGTNYTFGEKGAEMVTPLNSTGNDNSNTVNIYINNMSADKKDTEKLRKEILSILHSVNSNRGRQ